jgi:flagellar hook-basal body complex protein FliE
MNEINNTSLLLQMRNMQDTAASKMTPLAVNNEGLPGQINSDIQGQRVQDVEKVEFSSLLKSAIQQVNGIQKHSNVMKTDFISGKEGVDLAQVMIASEKSSVAFGAMLEIRNKLLKAYEEVKSIRV